MLVIHLRMTGRLHYAESLPDRSTHVIFQFDNGDKLFYSDTRTLGTLYAMEEANLCGLRGFITGTINTVNGCRLLSVEKNRLKPHPNASPY